MPVVADLPPAFLLTVAVALGLAFGSFLNVVIHRLPRGESVVSPGSRCPACGRPVAARDNLPVLSWLLLRGQARCCGARIPARYPLVEAIGGLLGASVLEGVALPLVGGEASALRLLAVFAVYLALTLSLVALAFIDLDTMLLPDSLTLGGTALGLVTVPLRGGPGWWDSALGAALGFALVWVPFIALHRRLRGRPGMGLGDAKLVMLAGAWFGWVGAVFALLAGAVQGTIAAVAVLLATGRLEEPAAVREERARWQEALARAEGEERRALEEAIRDDPLARPPEPGTGGLRVPFGPFLALAVLEYLFFGETLTREYLGWLGAP